MTKISLSIFDPNTLLPHRAGIAGLAMVWNWIESQNFKDPPIRGTVVEDGVTLVWESEDHEAIQWLLEQAYQINNGLLVVPALNLDERGCFTFNQGMLNTFLQHGQQRDFVEDAGQPKQGKKKFYKTRTLSFTVEPDKPDITEKYTLLESCYYTQASKLAEFVSKGKRELKGQNFPGLIECFVNGCYRESTENLLALLFLPIACNYYHLPRINSKGRSALVIPEVRNLKEWVRLRHKLPSRTYASFHSNSSGESALHFLLQEKSIESADLFRVEYCEVYQLGSQSWDGSQSYLKQAVHRIKVSEEVLELYKIASRLLPARVQVKKDGDGAWLAESKALAWISDNLIADKSWYSGFFEFRKAVPIYPQDRRGLITMTEHLNEDERVFFDAVQGAFKKYRGQQIDNAIHQGRQPDWDQITKKVIYRLQRPTTQQQFATALVEFLSQVRSKAALSSGPQIFWWIHREENWRKARDLALLAVATYQGKSAEEKDSTDKEEPTKETANVL
jgi:CRISPR-associated protein Cas8a1/Csx13